jgi:protein phosphatase
VRQTDVEEVNAPVAGRGKMFLNEDMSSSETFAVSGGSAVVLTKPEPTGGGPNEDGAAIFALDAVSAVLVVADGVGGHPGGAHASTVAIEALGRAIAGRRSEGSLRSAIVNGFEEANEAVLALGVGAATTLAVAKIESDRVRTFHVGDSMIALIGQRGRRKLVTVPHSPVGYAVESGYLDERDAMHHAERHFVSNVVGSDTMRIDVGPSVPIGARDTVLLATDGLLDNLFMDEIVEHVRKGRLPKIADAMGHACRSRMTPGHGGPCKPDDMTFVLYRRDRASSA